MSKTMKFISNCFFVFDMFPLLNQLNQNLKLDVVDSHAYSFICAVKKKRNLPWLNCQVYLSCNRLVKSNIEFCIVLLVLLDHDVNLCKQILCIRTVC